MANTKVTTGVIKDDAVGADQLASNSVVTASIVDNAITTAKINDDAILTAKISNSAITNAKMSANSVDSDQYVDGSIDTAHIGDGQITSAKLDTNISVSGELTVGSHLNMGDGDRIKMGAGADLQIYHDASGNHSYITESGSGDFFIQGNNLIIENTGGENYFRAVNGGAVQIYYAGAAKLATTSSGIDVTGTATMDGLTVDGTGSFSSTAPYVDLFETDTTDVNSRIVSNSGSLRLQTVGDNGSGATNRLLIDHATGDISFYEDTGSTAKFFWDASAESLGIGTTSPSSFDAGARQLVVGDHSVSSQGITIAADTNSILYFADGTSSSEPYMGSIIYNHSNNDMTFRTNGFNAAMVIDSSQNLLVSKTSSDTLGTAGHELHNSGMAHHTRATGTVLYLNRTGNDGNIIDLRKDNTTVGSIGTANGDLHIDGLANHSGIRFQAGSLLPRLNGSDTNGTIDLGYDDGSAIHRFRNLYLSGTVNDLTLAAGNIETNTSNNLSINTPNSLRINIDSNNSATDQVFVIGHNQTSVDTNNSLLTILESGKCGIGTSSPSEALTVTGGICQNTGQPTASNGQFVHFNTGSRTVSSSTTSTVTLLTRSPNAECCFNRHLLSSR